MTQPAASSSSSCTLFPQLETTTDPLIDDEKNRTLVEIGNNLSNKLTQIINSNDILEDIGDRTVLPQELFLTAKRVAKPKVNPLQRLKDLPSEEVEDEEETEDEEEEDEEVVEDEEEDAGGDYLVSHFDNGENYEDNDEEGDDMTIQ